MGVWVRTFGSGREYRKAKTGPREKAGRSSWSSVAGMVAGLFGIKQVYR